MKKTKYVVMTKLTTRPELQVETVTIKASNNYLIKKLRKAGYVITRRYRM